MDRDTWRSLPKAAQDAWDTIDDASKNKILTYAMNRGAKGTSNGLSVNQAESESANDSPDAPDESNIIFECSNLEIHESISDINPTTDSSPGTTFKTLG